MTYRYRVTLQINNCVCGLIQNWRDAIHLQFSQNQFKTLNNNNCIHFGTLVFINVPYKYSSCMYVCIHISLITIS